MKNRSWIIGFGLVLGGLLGSVALQVLLRVAHPAIVGSDLVQGLWLGVSIGLEIIGLALLLINKKRLQG